MNKKIYVGIIVIVFLCSGCSNTKSLKCTKTEDNNTYQIKIENNKITSTTEIVCEDEERAISYENYLKEDSSDSDEITREGKNVIIKNSQKCDNSCKEAKSIWEKMGYKCE